jgi:hypothetical protein
MAKDLAFNKIKIWRGGKVRNEIKSNVTVESEEKEKF